MQLGRVYDAACEIALEQHPEVADDVVIPVVAECDDSFLNDCRRMQVSHDDVRASYAAALASRGATSPPDEGAVDAPITPGEFAVRAIVPQLSLNFGSSRGWSYLGAGLGFSQLKAGRAESDLEYSPQLLTLNLGGGARWFVSEHVAFTLDGRYYRLSGKELEAGYVEHTKRHITNFRDPAGFRVQFTE